MRRDKFGFLKRELSWEELRLVAGGCGGDEGGSGEDGCTCPCDPGNGEDGGCCCDGGEG